MAEKKIGEGKAALLGFEVLELSGGVLSETTRSETEVVSGAYDNVTHQRNVTSKVTRYQTIMLREDDGTEHAAELVNMILPCREGQRITLWRLGQGGWFRAVNHNTRQQVISSDLGSAVFPWGWAILAGLVTFFVLLSMNPYEGIDWLGVSVLMAAGGYGVGFLVGAIMTAQRKSAIQALVRRNGSAQPSPG